MAAKSVWDVVFAGLAIFAGVLVAVNFGKHASENARWYRLLCWFISSVGCICWGIGRVTLHRGDLWPFSLMAGVGYIIASGMFEGGGLADMFPTLFGWTRHRGTAPSPESGTKELRTNN